jgi:hypothetical protein
MIRVQPDTQPNQKNVIEIAAARNEVEPFQVIVTALNHKLEGVTASISNLEDGKGNKLDRSQITLYRQQYVYIRNPSPYSTEPPGWWPDALVPFVNPVDGKPISPMQFTREEVGGKVVRQLTGARFTGSPSMSGRVRINLCGSMCQSRERQFLAITVGSLQSQFLLLGKLICP